MLDFILGAVLIFAAVTGFSKGFLKSLIGLFGNLLALLCSYLLATPVSVWINEQFGLVPRLAAYIQQFLPLPDNLSVVMASFEGMGKLYAYLDQSFLPDSLKQSILTAVQEQVDAVGAGVYATMADIVVTTIASSILHGLTLIGLWFLFCAALFFISHVLAGVVHLLPVVGLIDRLGGMLVSLFLVSVTMLLLYQGISVLGLMEGSLFSQSAILHFYSQFLNPDAAAVGG